MVSMKRTPPKSFILALALFLACSSDAGSKPSTKQSGKHMNRLSRESSPYLLQHADNPVDWYPWGEEAFLEARKRDKPIFLSIGYSTCHWCHVMEHESFEDEEVAQLMNDNFVCIKVDREELPEIDHVYMSVCQAMTGRGGWPLTIVMTPSKEPFFAGTYFPKSGQGNRPGMMQLIPFLADAWKNRKLELSDSINKIKRYLNQANLKTEGESLTPEILTKTFISFTKSFDSDMGGFGRAPKFPSPHNLLFLLRYYHMTKNKEALTMVETTLQNMRKGGIWDHIGFGFHRYSTDKNWLLPHFEKMLYDQAMISMAYLEAFQITGKEEYGRTVREIYTYVLRDMTSPEGGFYSAEDADSEGEEGKFYLWTTDEVQSILGKEEGEKFNTLLNIRSEGNFRDEASSQKTARNIPHFITPIKEVDLGFMEKHRKSLFEVREERIHPIKDDKILTDWNGLMIASFAKGSVALNSPEFYDAARKGADFILKNLRSKDGRLLKRYRQGKAGLQAHLDDYVFVIWGLLELYESGFEEVYLQEALNLSNILVNNFWDGANGGFFLGSKNAEKLIARAKTGYDGAIPSGNSIAVGLLHRLARITGDMKWAGMADTILKIFSKDIERSPRGFSAMLLGYIFETDSPKEVVIVGNSNQVESMAFLASVNSNYEPNKIILFKDMSNKNSVLSTLAPWIESQTTIDGKTTAYICENFACNLPTTDLSIAIDFIKN